MEPKPHLIDSVNNDNFVAVSVSPSVSSMPPSLMFVVHDHLVAMNLWKSIDLFLFCGFCTKVLVMCLNPLM